jgi:hypothetical protein
MTANNEMADVVIVGGEPVHTPHGLIVTVDTSPGHEANAERLHRNEALQNSLGIPARVVNLAELRELQPQAIWDDVSHAAYESDSGYVDAIATTRGMERRRVHLQLRFRPRALTARGATW